MKPAKGLASPPAFSSFNENQYIDVSGAHERKPPDPSDSKGPYCGLNALAK